MAWQDLRHIPLNIYIPKTPLLITIVHALAFINMNQIGGNKQLLNQSTLASLPSDGSLFPAEVKSYKKWGLLHLRLFHQHDPSMHPAISPHSIP
jgi:hypothetical protein